MHSSSSCCGCFLTVLNNRALSWFLASALLVFFILPGWHTVVFGLMWIVIRWKGLLPPDGCPILFPCVLLWHEYVQHQYTRKHDFWQVALASKTVVMITRVCLVGGYVLWVYPSVNIYTRVWQLCTYPGIHRGIPVVCQSRPRRFDARGTPSIFRVFSWTKHKYFVFLIVFSDRSIEFERLSEFLRRRRWRTEPRFQLTQC